MHLSYRLEEDHGETEEKLHQVYYVICYSFSYLLFRPIFCACLILISLQAVF